MDRNNFDQPEASSNVYFDPNKHFTVYSKSFEKKRRRSQSSESEKKRRHTSQSISVRQRLAVDLLFGIMVAGAAVVGNAIEHHVFTGQRWVKGKARGKPMLNLTTKVDLSSYDEIGIRRPRVIGDKVRSEFMADTGASISIAGMQYARRLGIREDDLLQTTMMIHSADGSRIDVRGSVFVTVEGSGQSTKEQVYIC